MKLNVEYVHVLLNYLVIKLCTKYILPYPVINFIKLSCLGVSVVIDSQKSVPYFYCVVSIAINLWNANHIYINY